jgi:hypothetical protein
MELVFTQTTPHQQRCCDLSIILQPTARQNYEGLSASRLLISKSMAESLVVPGSGLASSQ